jgi:hypothetical protein
MMEAVNTSETLGQFLPDYMVQYTRQQSPARNFLSSWETISSSRRTLSHGVC